MPAPTTYPDIEVGDLVTADMLTSIQPATVVKASVTARNTTVTPVADPDLGAITLGVGTWKVELTGLFTCTTTSTQGIKTMWGFSGTWNNPIRAIIAPGNASPGTSPGTIDQMNLAGVAAGSSAAYYVLAGATYVTFREISYTVIVTAAGDLSLLWSQSASSANNTTLQPGSTFEVRQIG